MDTQTNITSEETLQNSQTDRTPAETIQDPAPQEKEFQTPPRKKKKGAGLIIFIVLLVLALAAAALYYFQQRRQPQETVTNFLESVREMDFASMESMLQSKDLTALDNADIKTPAFADFFKGINEKMTFKITRNKFDFQNGTARVTAHITYIDGSDIYKETVSEFLRQIVSTAFSGDSLTEEETQQKLAGILSEKADSLEDKYSEVDIVYPVIKTDDDWKIVSLDDATVKLMSANFKSVEDEISQSLNSAATGDGAAQAPTATPEDTIDMSNAKFTIRYTLHRISEDFAGTPCVLVYYDYTNNGSAPSSAMVDVNLSAYQSGEALAPAIPASSDDAVDHFMAEIQPGETVNVCQAFSLTGTGDITLEASEAFSLGGGEATRQILKAQ